MRKYIIIIVFAYTIFVPGVFASEYVPDQKVLKSNFEKIDTFRSNTYKQITAIRTSTQIDIDRLSSESKIVKEDSKAKPLDKTELPIAYIKLLLLSISSFVFSTMVIFYILLGLFVFVFLRYLYRKIRNR